MRELGRRMLAAKIHADEIDAIVVTHEHMDHVKGVGVVARQLDIPVYTTRGTELASSWGALPVIKYIDHHQSFAIDDIYFEPFPVPHDAREPCQFIVMDGQKKLGILTDTGSITTHVVNKLDACDALILECNHDVEMLQSGDYPDYLKERVGGDYGHLSNDQAAALLENINHSKLKHIVAAHLSDKNNSPDIVRMTLSNVLSCQMNWIAVADQDDGLGWRSL